MIFTIISGGPMIYSNIEKSTWLLKIRQNVAVMKTQRIYSGAFCFSVARGKLMLSNTSICNPAYEGHHQAYINIAF